MSMVAMTATRNALGVFSRPIRTPASFSAARNLVRSYSDKAEDKTPEDVDPAKESQGSEASETDVQLKEKDARIKELTDQVLYGKAEMQNLQRRSAEEKKNASDFGISKLAKDLTDSIDVLDLALKSVPEALRSGGESQTKPEDIQRALTELYGGVSLTRKSLLDMLRKHGIEQFDPTGQPFDPQMHEALYQAPIPDKTPGSVLECSKVGYKIKDRLLRVAQVGVVQDTS